MTLVEPAPKWRPLGRWRQKKKKPPLVAGPGTADGYLVALLTSEPHLSRARQMHSLCWQAVPRQPSRHSSPPPLNHGPGMQSARHAAQSRRRQSYQLRRLKTHRPPALHGVGHQLLLLARHSESASLAGVPVGVRGHPRIADAHDFLLRHCRPLMTDANSSHRGSVHVPIQVRPSQMLPRRPPPSRKRPS